MALIQKRITIATMVDPVTKQPRPQEKTYILLLQWGDRYVEENDLPFDKEWMTVYGRYDALEFIMKNFEDLDLVESYIISESVTPHNALSIYTFARLCKERGFLSESDEEDFNVDFATLDYAARELYEEVDFDDLYNTETNATVVVQEGR